MQRLYRKRIVLGVGGGIAAYKSAELIRRLRDQGAEVQVVMTAGGQEFITPLTLQALSGHPVHLDLLDPEAEAAMGHIELAKWADLVLIAIDSERQRQHRAALVEGEDLGLAVAPKLRGDQCQQPERVEQGRGGQAAAGAVWGKPHEI